MKLYDCKVRLHGDVRDEVRKRNVTMGEIRMLQQIHGEDAVSEVTPLKTDALSLHPDRKDDLRTEAEERDRLAAAYGEKAVAQLFGVKQVSIVEDPADKPLPVVKKGKAGDAESLVA